MLKYKNYLFDLDGTLTDPGVGIRNSIKYALEKFGLPIPDNSLLNEFIGPPLMESFRKYFGVSEPGPKTSPFPLSALYHTFKKNAIPFIEKIIPYLLREFHPITVYAQTRDFTRESFAWKIFSFVGLRIEQFIDDDFLCLYFDVVHHLHPPHLIGCFEVFVDALSLGKLHRQRG